MTAQFQPPSMSQPQIQGNTLSQFQMNYMNRATQQPMVPNNNGFSTNNQFNRDTNVGGAMKNEGNNQNRPTPYNANNANTANLQNNTSAIKAQAPPPDCPYKHLIE